MNEMNAKLTVLHSFHDVIYDYVSYVLACNKRHFTDTRAAETVSVKTLPNAHTVFYIILM